MSTIRDRSQQAQALIRNEGVGAFFKRAWGGLLARVRDSGDVYWMLRTTNAELTAEGADKLVIVPVEPGSREEEIADSIRPITGAVRRQRLDAGGVRYLVHAGDVEDPIYHCWTYSKRLLVAEHLGVGVPLPDGLAGVEDSYITPAHRGARAAISTVDVLAREMHGRGFEGLVAKVDADNEAALGAGRISNWTTFGKMRGTVWFNRFPRWRVELEEPVVPQLKELEHRPRGF